MKLNEAREIGLWSLYTTKRDKAKEDGSPFTLSFEEFAKLSLKRCVFCNARGNHPITSKFKVSNLEPLFDAEGLTPKNALPVCYHCSRIRRRLEWATLKQTAKICKKLEKLKRA